MVIVYPKTRVTSVSIFPKTPRDQILQQKFTLTLNYYRRKGIGGSRGRVWHTPLPLWDPILSFLRTFSPKSPCIRGPHPPNATMPPMGNPRSATERQCSNKINPFLAELISCAITNHSSGRDCCCWHQHRHCRQKLTSSSVPI